MTTKGREYAFTLNNYTPDEIDYLRRLAKDLPLTVRGSPPHPTGTPPAPGSPTGTPDAPWPGTTPPEATAWGNQQDVGGLPSRAQPPEAANVSSTVESSGRSRPLPSLGEELGPKAKKAKLNGANLKDVVVDVTLMYLVLGYEIGEECGTPHIQGFIYFKNAKSWNGVRDVLPPRCSNIKKRYYQSSAERAAGYCLKDGQYEQYGSLPEQGKRTDLHEMADMVIEGKSRREIALHNPTQFIVHNRGLEALRRAIRVPPEDPQGEYEFENLWLFGGRNAGKSRYARDKYPGDLFVKSLDEEFWCTYRDESTVLIEEWTPKTSEKWYNALMVWTDRYCFWVKIKGEEAMKIKPRRFIITSNFSINDCFPNPYEYDRDAILKRFKEIKM